MIQTFQLKMLRLQSYLRGKALETVKDLGYTAYAYEIAKEKLTRKYGGKRRPSLTHLVTLRGLNKVRHHNLDDVEELLAVLDRILVAMQDGDPNGEMKSFLKSFLKTMCGSTSIGCMTEAKKIVLRN